MSIRNLAPALNEAAAGRSQAEAAYQRLRGEILHGELMPGAKLRAAELQDSFELGLTPIREALMRLTAEGLVVTESHRGARVAEITAEGLADLMQTRRDLERLCLPRAIERGDESWEAEIVAALHLLTRTPLPGPEAGRDAVTLWETRHRRFHLALVGACGSEWLLRFWHSLADHAERYRKARLSHYHEEAAALREDAARARDMNENHARIADAVLARDASRATALMDAHLGDTERAVARLLAGTERRALPG
ncbi:GntR family transcriptional regulator [Roseomonas sp. BN140053]|uniref:GntR family transcriptional regulator n=1 Tax=Roseomonas sp. BN140053 TaxID=3391898 RepID=UPI0039ECEA24